MGNMQLRIASQVRAGAIPVLTVVGERDSQDRCVDDDQR